MAGLGQTTIDFGAFPGKSDASVVITGQTGILTTSLPEAYIFPKATADHTVDEHMAEDISVFAGNIVAGTGFTIYAFSRSNYDSRLYGLWTVNWVWV